MNPIPPLLLLWLPLIGMAASVAPTNSIERSVTIRAIVPDGVGTVFLTGNRTELGPWDPGKFAMTGTGSERTAELRIPEGTQFEFKFTLGSWEREALGPSGALLPNHRIHVDADVEVTIDIPEFRSETDSYLDSWMEAGILGRLVYWENVRSRHLERVRHVEIWLPPGYDDHPAEALYPVLYMHDGQNLFDPRIASTGIDWGVDEAIVRGVKAGRIPPVIVVGVWCTDQRGREYSPWDWGHDYARFLAEELIPKVNQEFRTRTGPENTGVMGSSMGGLISFYLCWKHPEVFGRAGCLSTHFPYSEATLARFRGDAAVASGQGTTPLIEREIADGARFPRGVRMYLDYGTRGPDAEYEAITVRVSDWLAGQGLRRGQDFVVRKFEGAEHNEAAWRARLDEPLTFLFGR